MARADRRAWLNAAWAALRHVPLPILKRGAAAAMRKADHPSKIVPAIMEAIEPDLAAERRISRLRADAEAQRSQNALPAPGDERATRDELDAICKQHGVGRYSSADGGVDPSRPAVVPTHADPDRPCRAPTRADYIRLGVDPAVLDEIESGRGEK